MKKSVLIVTAVAFGSLLSVSAFAQETKPLGLSVRAGIFLPTQKTTKNAAGKQWFSGGVEYKLGDLSFANENKMYSASYSISADLFQKKDYRNIPVLLNYVGRTADGFYYTAGAGVGFVRELDATNRKKSSTALAYQAGIGYEFTKSAMPLFVEAKYIGSSKSKLNGFGVFVGVRF
ncbi:MAG: outer membrane beta-barrel protein [Armatimonadetes bacterium]|nr:outer membrane beta-barrel protein [Armatimonadota bacterium]